MAAELFHAEGRTDKRTYMTKLLVASRRIANAAKMHGIILSFYHTSSWNGVVLATRVTALNVGIYYVHSILFIYIWEIFQRFL